MNDFPEFMQHPANRIAKTNQATPGVEGYIFDGADGSQMAFWSCRETAVSAAHAHDYDEYMIVVQGCYTLVIEGERIPLKAGQEYLIPRGSTAQWRSSGRDENHPLIWRSSGRSHARITARLDTWVTNIQR